MTEAQRIIMVTALRVLEFMLAFPEPNPGFQQATNALRERLARADVLAGQERSGKVARRVASSARKALIRELRSTLLKTLAAVARVAFRDQPELIWRFQVPGYDIGLTTFMTEARSILTEAEAVKEVLLEHGLPESLLPELSAALDRFDALGSDSNAGRRAHVGARADLDVVVSEMLGIVRHLDALNRYRFRDVPEQLAAWNSARNVAWANHREGTAAPAPVPAPAPVAVTPGVSVLTDPVA